MEAYRLEIPVVEPVASEKLCMSLRELVRPQCIDDFLPGHIVTHSTAFMSAHPG